MAFIAKDLSFKIEGGSVKNEKYLDLRIACGTGTSPIMVDFNGKMDDQDLIDLHNAMQLALAEIAKGLGLPVPIP